MKALATRAFLLGDRAGIHVLPPHYYSSVPRRKTLRRTETQWRRPLPTYPFAWDLEAQAAWVQEVAAPAAELSLAQLVAGGESVGGFRYGPVEGQLLYAVLRSLKPAHVVEIGSGSSTWIMSQASQRNAAEGADTSIVACDPYQADAVRHLPHVTARAVGGWEVDDDLEVLGAGDVLFIDSTHTVRTGSELAHLYLEAIPKLAPGVLVHIHDIYLPYLYAPDLYGSLFDWQETTLVAALLAGNDRLTVRACLSALHHDAPAALATAFPAYRPRAMDRGLYADERGTGHFPSSLWLQVNDVSSEPSSDSVSAAGLPEAAT